MPVVLPIGQRPKTTEAGRQVAEARPEELAGRAGQQVLIEALRGIWTPAATSEEAGSSVRISVKNTFINVSGEDPTPSSSLHQLGAVTCSARFSEPTPSSIPLMEEDEDLGFVGAPTPEASMALGGRLQARAPAMSDPVPQVTPPPTYQAPVIFREDSAELPPPPQVSPSEASHGRHIFMAALGVHGNSPASATDDSVKVKVRNTFIEVDAGDDMDIDDGIVHPKSCTAALHGGAMLRRGGSGGFVTQAQSFSSALMPQSTMVVPQGMVMMQQPMIQQSIGATTVMRPMTAVQAAPMIRTVAAPATTITVTAAPVVTATAPSLGSEHHGKIDEKGEALCQPCAWFHKGAGCQNGLACRRCHLCPEGELKLRKKQKVQRLRNTEAGEHEHHEGELAAGSSEPNSKPSSLGVPGNSSRREPSPRWADIGVDEDAN